MSLKIIIFLTIGILIGVFLPATFITYLNFSVDCFFFTLGGVEVFLLAIMFFVGLDIALTGDFVKKLKTLNWKFWFFPLFNILFSIIGGAIAAFIIGIKPIEGMAVSSGMGWYSFTSAYISKFSVELGTIALFTNMLRELMSLLLAPILSKKFGFYENLAISGATCMDTSLPVYAYHYQSSITVILCVMNGMILSFAGAGMVVLLSAYI